MNEDTVKGKAIKANGQTGMDSLCVLSLWKFALIKFCKEGTLHSAWSIIVEPPLDKSKVSEVYPG